MHSASFTSTVDYSLILFTHGLLILNYCSGKFVPERYLPPALYLPPTCPDSQLYHIPTQKCYSRGDKGPCGNKMILAKVFPSNYDSQIGECSCEDHEEDGFLWTRPLVRWPDTQQCYFVYDQGPCPEGQWLVGSGGGSCEQIPCPTQYLAQRYSKSGQSKNKYEFLFAHGGKCYMTATQSFCPSGEQAIFINGNFEPNCVGYIDSKKLPPTTRPPQPATVATGLAISCPEGKELLNNNCESISNI